VSPTAPAAGGGLTLNAFFDSVRQGRLVVQRCTACRALAVPPKAVCTQCQAMAWEPAPLGGEGEIASYTVIRVPPNRLAAEAPYAIAVVRMVEGVALLGRMTHVALDALRVGLPVRLAAARPHDEPPVIRFEPW